MRKRFLILIAFLLIPAAVAAEGIVTSGFLSKQTLQPGLIISSTSNPGLIEAATSDNRNSLLGVVTTAGSVTVATAGEVQVATSGVVTTLVSNLNGDVKVGDRITVGGTGGLGLKATTGGQVVGVAQASLDKTTSGARKVQATSAKGEKADVYVAEIPVLVGVTYYLPTGKDGKGSTDNLIPIPLANLANAVAGRNVPLIPMLISFITMIIALSVAAVVLNSAVRSSMISIGRNPLSKKAVNKGMIQAVVISLIILIFGLVAAFVILRLA